MSDFKIGATVEWEIGGGYRRSGKITGNPDGGWAEVRTDRGVQTRVLKSLLIGTGKVDSDAT